MPDDNEDGSEGEPEDENLEPALADPNNPDPLNRSSNEHIGDGHRDMQLTAQEVVRQHQTMVLQHIRLLDDLRAEVRARIVWETAREGFSYPPMIDPRSYCLSMMEPAQQHTWELFRHRQGRQYMYGIGVDVADTQQLTGMLVLSTGDPHEYCFVRAVYAQMMQRGVRPDDCDAYAEAFAAEMNYE